MEPTPIVLSQRRHELTYDDEEGAWYHYPKVYWKLVATGAPFVYYQPRERDAAGRSVGRLYFGAGVIGGVYPDSMREDHRYAEILDYEEFTDAVPMKDPGGGYLEVPTGKPIVFQQAVRPLDWTAFERIAALGGLLAVPPRQPREDTAADIIAEYDRRLASATPHAIRQYVNEVRRSTTLSKALKARAEYRCQICGADGFIQKNGLPYAEAHHVVEVSKQEPGSLASSNVLVLCPTCHRKMRYAPVTLEPTATGWLVRIDGVEVEAMTVFG